MRRLFIATVFLFSSIIMYGQYGRQPESAADKIGSAVVGAIILSVVIWLFNRNKEKNQEKAYNQSVDSAIKTNQVNPNDYQSLFMLGIDNYKNQNDHVAMEYFEKCYKLNSSKIENLIFIGNIYHLTGQYEDVIKTGNLFFTELDKNKKYVDTLLTGYKLPLAEFQYFFRLCLP